MKKPMVFNYRKYVELEANYKALVAENQKLMDTNHDLRSRLTNLEIKYRILEADKNEYNIMKGDSA